MRDYQKYLETLLKLPWRKVLWLSAGSFMLASLFSFGVTRLLMPDFKTAGDKNKNIGLVQLEPKIEAGSADTLRQSDVDTILKRNLFNSEGTLGDQDPAANAEDPLAQSDKAVKTSLPIKVVGLIYGGTPFTGRATIENTSKKLINSFVVGDTIVDGATVKEIHRDRIFISRGSRVEFAELEDFILKRSTRNAKKPARAPGGISAIAQGPAPTEYREEGFERKDNKIQLTDQYKSQLLSAENLPKVLQDAKAEPNMVNGELKGFRLTRIREDSIYLKAGLQNDDIVEEINGVPLNDVAGSLSLLGRLKSESQFEIRVRRGDQVMNLEMSVN